MITISAKVQNSQNKNHIVLKTLDKEHSITIPSKSNGFGSSVNGGETLFLALAICYCNDLYREAEKKSIILILTNGPTHFLIVKKIILILYIT